MTPKNSRGYWFLTCSTISPPLPLSLSIHSGSSCHFDLPIYPLPSYCSTHFRPRLWPHPSLHLPSAMAPPTSCSIAATRVCDNRCSKSVSSLHTITSESTQCTCNCSHSTTNPAGTNQFDRNERARSLGAEQRYQINGNGNGNGSQTKPSPKGSPKMQQRSRKGSWLFGRRQQQR